MLLRNVDAGSRYGALREVLSNLSSIAQVHPEPRFWAEVIEEAIADHQLNALLAPHADNEVITAEGLQQWQRLFAKRWARVRDTSLAYPSNTQSAVNQIYAALADFFQPLLNIPRFQLLMPDIESAASCITMTDLAETNLSLTDIVLSDDCKSFIEVKACLSSAVEDAVLKHTQVLEDGKAKLLSDTEASRVVYHHPAAFEFYQAIERRYDFKHNGATVGARLQILIEGLRSGGVNRSRNEAERQINEMNATEPANLAILDFSDIYMSLSKEQRDELNELKDDHHNFSYYWDILALQQQRKIDAIKNNKRLSAVQRASRLREVHANITTCVQITANGLEALLEANKERLFAMRLNHDMELHGNIMAQYDNELQVCKHSLDKSMQLFANGSPYRAPWLGDQESATLEAAVLRWLKAARKSSFRTVMSHALQMIGVDTVIKSVLPALRFTQRNFANRLILSVLKNNFPVQIATTATHSYFLDKSGNVSICGALLAYPFEPGYPVVDRKPVLFAGLRNKKITQIACGLHHVLCLTDDGNIYGRGQTDKGQLGFLGQRQAAFVKIPGLPQGLKIDKIMSHLNNSVLITPDSKIYLMGESVDGSYNYFNRDADRNNLTLIREITGLPANVKISRASFSKHLLILTSDGKAFGMGESEFGQLGFKGYNPVDNLVEINGFPDGTRLVQAAAGNIHSLFLTDDGKVYSCGSNRRGQQGSTNHKNKAAPRLVTGLPEDDKVVQIAAGLYNSFFITERGKVFACGSDEYGQSGLAGYDLFPDEVTELTGLPAGTRIVGITPSMEVDSCTYFFADDGNVYGCGHDKWGHLGFPSGSDTKRPQLLPHIAALTNRIDEFEKAVQHPKRHHGRFFLPSREAPPEQVSYITEYPSPEPPRI